MNIRQTISRHLSNIPGWRTNRKIVVFESDDWGSIRMPSKEVYHQLIKNGIRADQCPYNRYDSLASEEDLSALFESLIKYKDKNGKHPIITANCVVANPDFNNIKKANYNDYFYELFTDTLASYPKHAKSFSLWKEGIKNNIFFPQFHGREHLHVNRWLGNLKRKSPETIFAFEHKMFGISTNITGEKRKSYMASLDLDHWSELEWQKKMLIDGLDLFKKIFSYHSQSFIATNYTWHSTIEPTLAEKGIRFIQGAKNQVQPNLDTYEKIRHYTGQQNINKQVYLSRNCFFEPSLNLNKDWVSSCLKEISLSFLYKKPAVISSHRLNFIGYVDEQNRTKNLALFDHLLNVIIRKWPEVEFFNTVELGNLIAED